MRKTLFLLAVGGTALVASAGAKAVPATVPGQMPAAVAASVQPAQYYGGGWRYRHWRHEHWRRWHRWHHHHY